VCQRCDLACTDTRAAYTWAVFGGKNSKEKVGFPSARERASFSEMCIVAARRRKGKEE
jgi:hypothetical protein